MLHIELPLCSCWWNTDGGTGERAPLVSLQSAGGRCYHCVTPHGMAVSQGPESETSFSLFFVEWSRSG